MGLWDRVQQHREEDNEPKPEKVFHDQKESKGQKTFKKIAYKKRNRWGSDANAHFEQMKRNMAKKFK